MNVIADIASQNLTRALAEQARTLSYADLPDDVRTLARQCLLDYVACTLAGSKEELTEILLAEAQEQGGAPTATVIGHARVCLCCRRRWSMALRPMRSISMT